MILAALALAWALPAAAAPKPKAASKPPVDAFIARLAAMVAAEEGQTADATREQDRRIHALSKEAAALGYEAAPALGRAAADAGKPLKLRLWLAASLESLHDPAAFVPLTELALDASAPDPLREAALRAAAACPVSARARRQTLCAALDRDPGPTALAEALFELESLGCEDPAPLERRALPGAPRAEWALTALAASPSPASLEALYRLFARYRRGSAQRLAVLRVLLGRAPELAVDWPRWSPRVHDMLEEEARSPAGAAAALALLGALGDPSGAPAAVRFLRDRDGGVAVAAAEALAALSATRYAPDIRKVYDGYLQDPRFAAGPGRDPVGWYDRLGAALETLHSAP